MALLDLVIANQKGQQRSLHFLSFPCVRGMVPNGTDHCPSNVLCQKAKRPENRRTWGLLHPHPAEAEIVKVLLYLLERLNSKVCIKHCIIKGLIASGQARTSEAQYLGLQLRQHPDAARAVRVVRAVDRETT